MCGIWFSVNFNDITKKHLSCISHRGPDSTKLIEIDQQIFIGFNRLSIIDLSDRSDQPMISNDNRYIIVFNGEIYNYKELRFELEKEGHKFTTESDTEVLLRSFIHWGEGCLERLNGMFAFVIFDTETDNCFIARDRLGIKPLYIYTKGEKIIISSRLSIVLKAFFELISLQCLIIL